MEANAWYYKRTRWSKFVDETRHTPLVIDPKDRRYWLKIATFAPVFVSVENRNIIISFSVKALQRWSTRRSKQFENRFTPFDTIHECDGQTNGRTDTGQRRRPRYAAMVQYRGKRAKNGRFSTNES